MPEISLSAPVVYAIVGISALALVLRLTPVAFAVARRRGWLDHPGGHKVQDDAVPYLGGAAIVVGFSVAIVLVSLVAPIAGGRGELALVLGAGVGLALVGLIDDLKHLGPAIRVAAEVVAGLVVWQSGIGAELFGQPVLDATVTVLWVVGVTNAVNLLDNMDGLSAGVVAIASLAFFVLAALNGQFLVATLAVALAACAAGFLRHNFHPAQIYMGDAGSMFLGFMVAVIGIKLQFPELAPELAVFVPVLVLGVPIVDTLLVSSTRLLHHRNPLTGGRDHASHRLVFIGLPVKVAVGTLYAAAAACGWLALILSRVDRGPGLLLIVFVLTFAVGAAVLLGFVPVYETSRRRRMMIQEVLPHEHTPAGGLSHGPEGTITAAGG